MTNLTEQQLRTLEEAWTLMPQSLEHVDTVSGQKLYSSKDLQSKVIDVLYKQKLLTPVIEKIENLIERQIILPCFVSKGFIKLMKHKIFSKYMDRATAGYFAAHKNRIYILLDNHLSKYLNVLDKVGLSQVTIHELQHYASYNLKMKHYNICKNAYSVYYREFFNRYFKVAVSSSFVDTVLKFVLKKFEWGTTTTSFLTNYATLLDKLLEQSIPDEDDRYNRISNLLSVVKIYLTSPDSFVSMLMRGNPNAREVVVTLLECYKKLGIGYPDTMAIQELVFPSEVAAIHAQHSPKSYHYNTIKSL